MQKKNSTRSLSWGKIWKCEKARNMLTSACFIISEN